jgi:hypothetical protein
MSNKRPLSSLPVHYGIGLNPTQIKRVEIAVKRMYELGVPGYKRLYKRFTKLAKQHPIKGGSKAWWRKFGL